MESGAGKDTGGVMTQPNEAFCSRCADSDVPTRMSIWSPGWVLERDYTVVILDCLGRRPRHCYISNRLVYDRFDRTLDYNI